MMHVISIWTVLLSCTAVSSAPQAGADLPVAQVVGLAAGPNFTLPRAFVVPNTCTNAGVPRVPHVPPPAVEEPGHDVEFSIIIEVKGSHVYPGWLDCYMSWLTARAKAGLGSLERGKKNEHLHIQAVARVRVRCVDKSQINQLRKEIKAAIGVRHNDGSGCQVAIKAFAPGQTWSAMLGYCTKDEGKPHYRMVRLNVTDDAITAGKQAWATARLSYEDDRLVLTKKNIFQSVWASMCAAGPALRNVPTCICSLPCTAFCAAPTVSPACTTPSSRR